MFTDQVVLITGAGRGLGRALALAFAREGARVAANDLTPINLDETLAQIQAGGGQGRGYIFDIAKKMPVQALIEAVRQDWERIDILVNNAAVMPRAGILEMDEWDWRRTLDVNLNGAFFTTQSVGRVMRAQGGGDQGGSRHGGRVSRPMGGGSASPPKGMAWFEIGVTRF